MRLRTPLGIHFKNFKLHICSLPASSYQFLPTLLDAAVSSLILFNLFLFLVALVSFLMLSYPLILGCFFYPAGSYPVLSCLILLDIELS